MDFDKALEKVGDFGPYQIVVFLSIFYYQANHGMQSSFVNFVSPYHEHWCKIHALQNFSEKDQKYIAIPYADDEDFYGESYEGCSMFNLPWENFTQKEFEKWNRTAMTENAEVVKCTQWVYDYSEYDATVSSEVRYFKSLTYM